MKTLSAIFLFCFGAFLVHDELNAGLDELGQTMFYDIVDHNGQKATVRIIVGAEINPHLNLHAGTYEISNGDKGTALIYITSSSPVLGHGTWASAVDNQLFGTFDAAQETWTYD